MENRNLYLEQHTHHLPRNDRDGPQELKAAWKNSAFPSRPLLKDSQCENTNSIVLSKNTIPLKLTLIVILHQSITLNSQIIQYPSS